MLKRMSKKFQSLIHQVYLSDLKDLKYQSKLQKRFNPLLIRSTFQTLELVLGRVFSGVGFNPLLIRSTFQTFLSLSVLIFSILSFNPLLIRSTLQTVGTSNSLGTRV